ncbi:hypothetical protein [Nannocystis punicea]|uniref:Lipoprotein n=1 Tax=Nannocystis punicea TaxID=2995304 RepID=A0ABY7GWI8_9BACT|nr:hypothetical protein [Nannocystis poenicansa]WAS91348.1 hypothetical protein O0S08_34605 [Nannocystis poenicansa]
MRSYSFTCLSLVFAVALACDSKGDGSGSDTSDVGNSTTEDAGTDGESSTGGSGDQPATTTAGPGTATSPGTSVGSDGSDTDDTATSTSGYDPTHGTTNPTSQGSDVTSAGTDGPVIEPVPCEGEPVVLDVASLAYTQGQIPPDPDPTGEGSSGGSGGEPVDPDTLYVRLSSQAATCADPSTGLDCGGNWAVTIRIPTAFQTPGLYHLAGLDVTGTGMITSEEPSECGFGGGTFGASFELISVDDKEVVGRLCHVDFGFLDILDEDVNLEGSFTAPRCQ